MVLFCLFFHERMMGTFLKVEADQSGPDALGILVPPARRTFVILRPRALSWDLLVCRADFAFHDMSHDEASAAAQGIYRSLQQGASVEVIPGSDGSRVRASIGPFTLVACPRRAGQPYVALVCSEAEAQEIADRLLRVVCPPEGCQQELYFNVRFFERPSE